MTYDQLRRILGKRDGPTIDAASLLDLQYDAQPVVHTATWIAEKGKSAWRNEDEFMRAVFVKIDELSLTYPDLEWVYHAVNENAHRRPGVKAGVADLIWDLPRWDVEKERGYHGVRLELKVLSGDIREEQVAWADRLVSWGYYCTCIFESVDKVADLLVWYVNLEEWNA